MLGDQAHIMRYLSYLLRRLLTAFLTHARSHRQGIRQQRGFSGGLTTGSTLVLLPMPKNPGLVIVMASGLY